MEDRVPKRGHGPSPTKKVAVDVDLAVGIGGEHGLRAGEGMGGPRAFARERHQETA
jgi:hypothetical protein